MRSGEAKEQQPTATLSLGSQRIHSGISIFSYADVFQEETDEAFGNIVNTAIGAFNTRKNNTGSMLVPHMSVPDNAGFQAVAFELAKPAISFWGGEVVLAVNTDISTESNRSTDYDIKRIRGQWAEVGRDAVKLAVIGISATADPTETDSVNGNGVSSRAQRVERILEVLVDTPIVKVTIEADELPTSTIESPMSSSAQIETSQASAA